MTSRALISAGSSHREGGGATVHAPPPDHHKTARHDRLIAAEAAHKFRDDLSDQPGIIALVGVNGVVRPFQFFPFIHDGLNSQGARHDIA